MQFRHVHKGATYGMAASAVAAVASSGEIPSVILAALAGAFGLSWFWESPRVAPKRYELGWNIASVLCLVYLTFLCFQPEGTLLTSGVYLLLFLLVNKLFNRQTSRDYLQLGLIGFLLLLAGTALNTDLSYAVCFFAFIVTATWHLTLLHLRREMEESELLRHADEASSEKVQLQRILDSRRIVGAHFLLGTGVISVLIFIGALTVFFLFPRVGLGFFFSQSRRGQLLTGFSERVELGTHGVLRENPAVVMRIEFPMHNGEHLPPLHWRGIAFDQYERTGRWHHTGKTRSPLGPSSLGVSLGSGRSSGGANELLQAIYLEPLGSQVLFGATWPLSYQVPSSMVPGAARVELQSGDEDDVYTTSRTSGFRYLVRSSLAEPSVQNLARVPDVEPPAPLQRYLQVPDVSSRVVKLAGDLTREVHGPYDKAQAITAYLRKNYTYTTHLGKGQAMPDPLDEFLFVTRAGHCEFFATALAVLLRLAQVPTREVHGFLGGEWNRWGRYLAVRQMDAHAWVEVWFEGSGWVTFDPTPPGAALAPARAGGLWNRLRQIEDSIELVWYKHMVEYDLGQQVKLARSTRLWAQKFMGSGHDAGWRKPRLRPQLLVGPLMIALGIFLVLRIRSAKRSSNTEGARRGFRPRDPATLLYQKALRRCARKGAKRGPGETPLEFAESLALRAFPGAPVIGDITSAYYRSRFGRQPVASSELRDLEMRLRTL